MSIKNLLEKACDKSNFIKPSDYLNFAGEYLEYVLDFI
jgi:hypothetical protein